MIYKSYLIEKNINLLKNKFTLMYGENIGLINEFKKNIIKYNKSKKIIRFYQEDILKNEENFFNEINNISLFGEQKIYFIENANDKILKLIEEINIQNNQYEVFLFSDILEKRSKLRNYFEKNRSCDVVPCYSDNELTIRELTKKKLHDFRNLNNDVLNLIVDNSNLDRIKLNNEIEKIQTFFLKKEIDSSALERLLNYNINENFNDLKDCIIKGDKNKTNKLLNSTILEIEKIPLYLNIINQRLNKLRDVLNLSKSKNISEALNLIKPAIFWKDKPIFIEQTKLWNIKKLNLALSKTYNFEILYKTNSDVSKNTIFKKLMVDLCILANA